MHSVQADESIVFSRSSFSCSRLVQLRNFRNTFFLGGPLVGRKLQTHSSSFTLTPLHPLSRPRQTEHGHGKRNMKLFIIGLYFRASALWPKCFYIQFYISKIFRGNSPHLVCIWTKPQFGASISSYRCQVWVFHDPPGVNLSQAE